MNMKEYPEKEEKQFNEKEEKELLKHEEKVEQQDMLSSISWALILIWAGIVFLSVNLGWVQFFLDSAFLSRILPENLLVFEPAMWSIIMLGAGIIYLLEVLLRVLLPQFHRNIGGRLVLAAVFLGVGLGNFFGWDLVWPLILIAVGVSVLAAGLARTRK